VCDDGDDRMWSFYVWLWRGGAGAPWAAMRGEGVVRPGYKESWTKAVSQPKGRQKRGIGCRGTVNNGGKGCGWRLIAPTKKSDLWPTWRQETCLDASQQVFVGSLSLVVLPKGICTSFANSPPCRWGGLLLLSIRPHPTLRTILQKIPEVCRTIAKIIFQIRWSRPADRLDYVPHYWGAQRVY